MAEYKVPQDVEAEDKLLGPFSFRQFIYLIIAVLGIAIGWGLSQLFIPLAIIPLPIVLLFGALALPLRKDQPMEIYLAAVLSFYLKPRKRLWQRDGRQSLVEITAPRVAEVQRAKELSQNEAERRLSYLADIVDTRGWSVRGVSSVPNAQTSVSNDVFYEAQQANDMLDESGSVGQSFDRMITQSDQKRHDDVVARMHNPQPSLAPASQPATTPLSQQFTPTPVADPYASLTPDSEAHLQYNPYPNMHQSIIDPHGNRAATQRPQPTTTTPQTQSIPPTEQPPQNPPTTTSEKPVSPDIINLASNSDLSIETIAHEAHRIKEKEANPLDDEVVISLH